MYMGCIWGVTISYHKRLYWSYERPLDDHTAQHTTHNSINSIHSIHSMYLLVATHMDPEAQVKAPPPPAKAVLQLALPPFIHICSPPWMYLGGRKEGGRREGGRRREK